MSIAFTDTNFTLAALPAGVVVVSPKRGTVVLVGFAPAAPIRH
ncbi:MAG: hypothetical protein JWL76_1039 [Thermoleophilia bacterium]|jgi:hypothetical protein|nr:hypothetical protein [Thermoleophilia bacterium]